MEMSPQTVLLLFFLTFVTQTTSSAPLSETSPSPLNSTLLFASGRGLRNCSCPGPVGDCDQALANAVCRCHSVVPSALPPAGPRGHRGPLTLWVTEPWVLQDVLNASTVAHLRLSFCGAKPLDSRPLTLLGLRTLRIHSALPQVPFPEQEITISPGVKGDPESDSDSLHVTVLDVAVLNGLSALKAYSVVGSTARSFSREFPLLTPLNPADSTQQNLVVSFVY